MAYVVVYHDNNSVYCVSESVEQYKCQITNYELFENQTIGKIIPISDSDFNLIQTYEKSVSYDGNNIILNDNPLLNKTKEQIDNEIKHLIESIEYIYPKHKDNNFGVQINAFKDLLNNFDSSTLTYPHLGNVTKYLKDQNNPVICSLQLV